MKAESKMISFQVTKNFSEMPSGSPKWSFEELDSKMLVSCRENEYPLRKVKKKSFCSLSLDECSGESSA